MKVYLESLGCRVNRSEVEELADQFAVAGHGVTARPLEADTIVVNTCAVTSAAERKTRRRISTLSRQGGDAHIALIGCFASLAPDQCRELPNVEWVIPNHRKGDTFAAVTACNDLRPRRHVPRLATQEDRVRRTRAFLKVQDGCDNECAYCVTRRLRGPSRSRPLSEVVGRAQELVQEGRQEIVITGVNLGAYGRHSAEKASLRALIEALLGHTDVPRLRLSSLEPWDLGERFFELWDNPRLCRQLHVPLQAGCDGTLDRMGRPITTAGFARLVEAARAAVPDMAVTTDLIAGFPGEDEAMFRTGYEFVSSMAFARLHVFAYSPRPGTPAAHFPDTVPLPVRQDRASRLRQLGADLAARYRIAFVGQRKDVLWERRRPDGFWRGWTDNYLRVVARAGANLHNKIVSTTLVGTRNGDLIGRVDGVAPPSAATDGGPTHLKE